MALAKETAGIALERMRRLRLIEVSVAGGFSGAANLVVAVS